MKRAACVLLAALGLILCTALATGASAPPAGFSVKYRLVMEAEDRVHVEIHVTGYTGSDLGFYADGVLGGYGDITGICSSPAASDGAGNAIPWKWTSTSNLAVTSSGKDFTLSYDVDTVRLATGEPVGQINQVVGQEVKVLFRNDGVFFTPDALFLLPGAVPISITLETFFPQGLDVYGSLPFADGVYMAKADKWEDLRDDFCQSFFIGGDAVLHVSSTGETGNTYDFVIFDWRLDYGRWFASDLETAGKQYVAVTDLFAKFYADQIGPHKPHRCIIADCFPSDRFPNVAMRGDFYSYMQIWPDNSMIPQVAHHALHSYMHAFETAKLHFDVDGMLYEGIPTYLESLAPALLLGEDCYLGRLYAQLTLDSRGHAYGIDQNQFHTRYNVPALKTYLLDLEIRDRTGGCNDILDFVRALWDGVKDSSQTSVQGVSEQQIESALADAASADIVPAYRKIRDTTELSIEDFDLLKVPFRSYVKMMADECFWGSELLLMCYLDVCSVKGAEWPHYGIAEHQIVYKRREALQPFKSYLAGLNKSAFMEDDILSALSASTGKDHGGFFEFWRSMGFDITAAHMPALSSWNADTDASFTTNIMPSMSAVGQDQTIRVVLDKTPLTFDSDPLIKDGRTMVPIRAIVEGLGGVVGWDPAENAVQLDFEGKTVKMKIGDPEAHVNGVEHTLDVAPFLSNDRTLVPVRFLSESLGCRVYWYGLVKTVVIER